LNALVENFLYKRFQSSEDCIWIVWFESHVIGFVYSLTPYTGSSKNMDGIWNRYNLKSTGRIYTFGVLKWSEKFKVLDLPQYICKLIILN